MSLVKRRTTMTVCWLTLIGMALVVVHTGNIYAQEVKTDSSRFSHKGLKVSLAIGKATAASDLNLENGNVSLFSLGYGLSDNLTLWFGLGRARHRNKPANDKNMVFNNTASGFQFRGGVQYKFRSRSRLQPYAKLGWGVYTMSEKSADLTKIGTGFDIAAGADYFFSRHFGFGFEVNYKILDFSEEIRKKNDESNIFDLDPVLNGNSLSIMVTLTIQ